MVLWTVVGSQMMAVPDLQVLVSPNTVTIGQPFVYELALNFDKNYLLVDVPDKADFVALDGVAVRDQQVTKNVNDDGRRLVQMWTTLALFNVGDFWIPTQQVRLKASGVVGDDIVLAVPAQRVQVQSVRQDESFSVQYSPLFYFNTSLDWGPFLGLAFLGILCLGGLYYGVRVYFKKSQKKSQLEAVVDRRTALERALDDLGVLKETGANGGLKDRYVRYSDILKGYLSEMLGVAMSEMTSREIFFHCQERLNEQDFRRVKQVLSFSDQIKFARVVPEMDEQEHWDDKLRDALVKLDLSLATQRVSKEPV